MRIVFRINTMDRAVSQVSMIGSVIAHYQPFFTAAGLLNHTIHRPTYLIAMDGLIHSAAKDLCDKGQIRPDNKSIFKHGTC